MRSKKIFYSRITRRRTGGRAPGSAVDILIFVTDQVRLGNMEIRHCPTDNMIGDYMTKPSQGEKVREFRRMILGMEGD